VPEERETVVIGLAEQMAVEPVLSDGVGLRQVHEPGDFARIAVMQSRVQGSGHGALISAGQGWVLIS
jgi:hypothetical protein